MAKLNSQQRDDLPESDFAVPGKRKLPIHDKVHALQAWRMLDRTDDLTDEEKSSARSKILSKLKSFGVNTADYEKNSDSPKELIACYFSNSVDLSENRVLKIPVARLGSFVHPVYGIVQFSQKDFDEIQENFSLEETGFRPYLRYGHSRYEGAIDDSPSVGFLSSLEQEEDVLWGLFEPSSEEVVGEIENRAYVNASAELKRYAISKRDGRPIGTVLTAVALTNAPFIPDMPNNMVLSERTIRENHVDRALVLNLSESSESLGNGLYANIHAKRERIANGSGETMRSPGDKGAPSKRDFEDSAKTAKKEKNSTMLGGNRQHQDSSADDFLSQGSDQGSDEELSETSLKMPEAARSALRRGLALYEDGKGGDGLQGETVSWARRLASGEAASVDKVKKMNAWFARHAVDRKPGWDSPPTPGYVAWLLWGGDSGKAWASKMVKALERKEELSNTGTSSDENMAKAVASAEEEKMADNSAEDKKDMMDSEEEKEKMTDASAESTDSSEDLSAHGNNLRKAAEALEEEGRSKMEKDAEEDEGLSSSNMLKAAEALREQAKEEDKEKMSSFGEFLSNLAKAFGFKKSEQYASGAKSTEMCSDTLENADQNLSDNSDNNDSTSSYNTTLEGGDTSMNEAQIKELVAQLLSEKTAELNQQFSDKLAAKDEEIQGLKSELATASETAQQFSNSVVESAFNARVNGLVAAGIPAAVVHAVADVARNLRGTEQKLSNGATVDTAEALFKALELMPGEARVNYEQVGQSLSDTSDNDPYADIVNRFNSAK